MNDVNICIRYGDEFGSNGCMTVRIPAWVEQGTVGGLKKFFKLAAQNIHRGDNREQITDLRRALEEWRVELEADAAEWKWKAAEDKGAAAELKRTLTKIERITKALHALDEALDKYDSTKKR